AIEQLQISEGRWAVNRTKNVEALRNMWSKQPNRVEVLVDPKLESDQLVILKKEHFDSLIAKYEELSSMHEEKGSQIDSFIQAVELLVNLAKGNTSEVTLKLAFSVVCWIRKNFVFG